MSNFRSGSAGARLVAEEVEREALRWAGPFGYAVLQVLRMGDHYSDADFQALLAQGQRELGAPTAPRAPGKLEPHPSVEAPAQPSSQPVAGLVLEPSPDASHYRPVTTRTKAVPPPAKPAKPVTTGRAGQPAQPPGTRDPAGRYVRRA
jgi:hypothetical protein